MEVLVADRRGNVRVSQKWLTISLIISIVVAVILAGVLICTLVRWHNEKPAGQVAIDYLGSYTNLTERQAIQKSQKDGLAHRTIERGGKALPHLDNFDGSRINFYVSKDGIVQRVEFF